MRRALFAVLVLALLAPACAHAAFPGSNGKIAFVRGDDIWTMNPDGTGQANITNSAAAEGCPAWSADGNQIAFLRSDGAIWKMFADGTGQTLVVPSVNNCPTWSPDGTALAYAFDDRCNESGVPGHDGGAWRIDADGSNPIYLGCAGTLDNRGNSGAAWSPDGQTVAWSADLAYFDIFTASAEPTTPAPPTTNLTNTSGDIDTDPSWSPDSTKIAWALDDFSVDGRKLWTMNADGTAKALLLPGRNPAWSPDGSKIAFEQANADNIRVANSNGTGDMLITDGTAPDWQPLNQAGPDADVLSSITDAPDPIKAGAVLTYTAQAKNLVGPDDATGVTLTVALPPSVFYISATPSQGSCSESSGTVTCNIGNLDVGQSASVTIQVEPQSGGSITANANVTATENDPVPGNNASSATTTVQLGGYPRPKGADPLRVSLVPAYRTCEPDQANLTHGPPLASPSCAPPAQTSGFLTVGTPDANGKTANSVGSVLIYPLGEGPPIDPNNGDQADVAYNLSLTDVRKQADLSDYTGELEVQATLRITDRDNTFSGNAPATSQDASIAFSAPCAATASATTGGACSVSTTQEAIVPGSVDERKRAIWELGKVRVFDGGADGDTGTGPNTLFAVQGVFVP